MLREHTLYILAGLGTNGHSSSVKFSIQRLPKRKRWRLEYRLHGIRHRPVFKTKELAVAEQERIEKQITDGGTAWLALPANERIELMAILREITETGKTLPQVWDEYKRRSYGKTIIDTKLQTAFDSYYKECQRLMLSKRTLQKIKSNVKRFVAPRAAFSVSQISREDIATHLEHYHGQTFNTYRISLHSFFAWCLKLKYTDENPVSSVDPIDTRRLDNDKAPPVLNYEDCIALLKTTLLTDPGLVRYVSLCLLAGLRPEREAVLLDPADIGEKIHIRGRTAKDRQQRYVEIVPALKMWLKLPSDWPVKNLRKRFNAIREKAGLIKIRPLTRPKKKGQGTVVIGQKIVESRWGQDCMRHTFASAFYALHGGKRTIEALGHGDYESLFGHYRRLMTKEDARKILSLTPKIINGTKRL